MPVTQRTCSQCGKEFTGHTARCQGCRATTRECVACERIFKGIPRKCPTCRGVARPCVSCGQEFTGRQKKCPACRIPERDCAQCGKRFRGSNRHCASCGARERQCAGCSRTFTSTHTLCGTCQFRERACADCGRTFTGHNTRCVACQGRERQCVGCGRTFTGHTLRCYPCRRWTGLSREEQQAAIRAYNNTRRALKRSAQIAGPVPARVYAKVLASGPCVYCGDPAAHVDHVRPLSRGGWEHVSNLVPACGPCNRSKQASLLTDWDPARVAHGVRTSPKVAAEFARIARGEAASPPN